MQTVERTAESRDNTTTLFVVFILIVLFAAGAYLIVKLRTQVHLLEAALGQQSVETKVIEDKLHVTKQNMETAVQQLESRVGMTEEELTKRTSELKWAQEQAASRLAEAQAATAKLAAAQQATSKQVQAVNSEVNGVKTQLGGARTEIATTRNDLASTRSDLAATSTKLESAIGDLYIHSGAIAKNHDELEVLKRKGDRSYYEFTLRKRERMPLSTVSLELKKADPKRSRFTLKIYADDHVYEKQDRTLGEPLQFYTGRDHRLYEVVVFNETSDGIFGYLSTPK